MTGCGLEGNAFLTSRKKFYWTGSRDLLETVEREEMICSIRPSRMVAAPCGTCPIRKDHASPHQTPDQELVNLTAADTCVIFHSDWNPQNYLQAQAQCHRFGQSKAVEVYRLITRNYEREMLDKASLKLGLSRPAEHEWQQQRAGPAVLQEGDRGPAEERSLRRHHGRERRRQSLLLDIDQILQRRATINTITSLLQAVAARERRGGPRNAGQIGKDRKIQNREDNGY
ncbi:chromodomain-helicase-DNA-binding protein 8-like [Gymnodraco acuticeps]|uniref:Chromodomain-helicase-DNA-binding protein 8-like n=1 Tax=Gymnodraco acuticeps TaxID=8218 RepID=A0A6P8WDK4_GYMAC|nr:chromodomain-helicase-DNA-binding protein 8-like [Gymnodraco acuticeps]